MDVSIALISETHFQGSQNLNLANHRVYRTDRATGAKGGGTAVIVSTKVKHHEIALPPVGSVEATGIQIQTTAGPLRLIAAYSPPGKLCPKDLDALLDPSIPTLIGGDLNAKHQCWNSRTANSKGHALLAHSKKEDFVVAGPTQPTHYPGSALHKSDVLDIVVMKNLSQSVELETLTALTSDHNPVLITVGDVLENQQQGPRHNYKKADWSVYKRSLEETLGPGPLHCIEDIDQAVHHFTAAVHTAIERSVPKQKPHRCSIYDLPNGIKKSIADKNRAQREWQRNRTPDLLKKYNELTRQLKMQISQHRGEKWEAATANLKDSDNSLWRITRRLTGKKEPNPPIQGKTHLACSNRDKAEVFADTLEASFRPNQTRKLAAEVELEVAKYHLEYPPEKEATTIEECSTDEVLALAKTLKNGKAPGKDKIVNQAIKMLPDAAVVRLTEIFNACMHHQYFPNSWKEARVVVFHKARKPLRDPANYCPISLLSGLSKLFERVILARLMDFATSENLLAKEQFGFRKEYSTNHQLLRVVDIISHGFNINKSTGVVFLDVAKAFDRVWHKGLLYKLIKLKFPSYLVKLLSSYLSKRTFHVAVREECSTSRPILAGVPQGSILGPFLFNIFTNDIPTDLKKTDLALYADDVAVISQSFSEKEVAKNLKTSLSRLSEWYSDWQITLNTSKTTATLYTKKVNRKHPQILLNGEEIKWENSSSYLGVTLDFKLSWRNHIEKTCQKATTKLVALYPLLRTKSMPMQSKVCAITAIIRPTMTYASPVWSGCRPQYRKDLQRLQSKALRIAAGAPIFARTADLHKDLSVEMLDDHLRKLNEAFYKGLDQKENPLIRKLADISANPFDRYPRPITALTL
ncbi:hypothetical protein NDU88_008500 [Pleurodeles waltl]|uniref:Reverse transcriptase domain-containing protein n=1 Tax=Pleurodeles waltl TaxID=8319 RepID=A0AAV7NWE9_PLEWA|nr:hypothetical protein NDU88_008500 [Pleurodeles waltl]